MLRTVSESGALRLRAANSSAHVSPALLRSSPTGVANLSATSSESSAAVPNVALSPFGGPQHQVSNKQQQVVCQSGYELQVCGKSIHFIDMGVRGFVFGGSLPPSEGNRFRPFDICVQLESPDSTRDVITLYCGRPPPLKAPSRPCFRASGLAAATSGKCRVYWDPDRSPHTPPRSPEHSSSADPGKKETDSALPPPRRNPAARPASRRAS